MTKKLLIVGIDPGTTVGYAIFDLNGRLIMVDSSRGLSLSNLIMKIMPYGRVVLVGADVAPAPKFVVKFAKEMGARIIAPRKNLPAEEKRKISSRYKTKNRHEGDSIVACVYAFKKMKPILEKIDLLLEREGKIEHIDIMKEMVLMDSDLSLRAALDSLEQKKEYVKTKEKRKRTGPIKIKIDEKKYLQLQNKLLQNQVLFLNSKVMRLRAKIQNKANKKAKAVVEFKNQNIKRLSGYIKEQSRDIILLEKRVGRLKKLLFNIKGKLVVAKIKNLSWEEVKGKEFDDILFVDDPTVYSVKSIEFLKGHTLLSRKKIKKKLDVIYISDWKFEEEDDFIVIAKEELERAKKGQNALFNVIKEYKKERENELEIKE